MSASALIASYELFSAGYSDASGAEFDRRLVAKLEALPGIRSVALSDRVPLGFGGSARVAGDPLTFVNTIAKTIHELNANLVVFDVTTLELRAPFADFGQRVASAFVGAFGLLALVLAGVGIYG